VESASARSQGEIGPSEYSPDETRRDEEPGLMQPVVEWDEEDRKGEIRQAKRSTSTRFAQLSHSPVSWTYLVVFL